jgi:DNA helicase INO80
LHSVTAIRTQTAKKLANAAASLVRKQFTRLSGRPVSAARRAMKEMLGFWRRNEREERDLRKKAEREAQEKRRLEEEQREARRQAKKLNFLITQTELYSHFVGKKSEKKGGVCSSSISNNSTQSTQSTQSNTQSNTQSTQFNSNVDFADVDDEVLHQEASRLAANAAAAHQARLAQFDGAGKSENNEMDFMNPSTLQDAALLEQPSLLQVQLKAYQLKGLTWLASLYEQVSLS